MKLKQGRKKGKSMFELKAELDVEEKQLESLLKENGKKIMN
jgi:hypothetical protein